MPPILRVDAGTKNCRFTENNNAFAENYVFYREFSQL